MRSWALFFLGTSVIAPVTAAAQVGAPPSVDALVAEVIERDPSVRARSLRRDALGGEARAAGIYPDPQVAVMVDRVPQAREAEMPMIRYQATQMFPWPGKLPLMHTAVERQRDAAGADVDVRRLDLRLEVGRARLAHAAHAARHPAVYVAWRSFALRREPKVARALAPAEVS